MNAKTTEVVAADAPAEGGEISGKKGNTVRSKLHSKKKLAQAAKDPSISGRVMRIAASTKGNEGTSIKIELAGKKGAVHVLPLDPADPISTAAILGIANAALVGGHKIYAKMGTSVSGAFYASEVEIRSK